MFFPGIGFRFETSSLLEQVRKQSIVVNKLKFYFSLYFTGRRFVYHEFNSLFKHCVLVLLTFSVSKVHRQ
jgi:hypothetical protein